MSEVIRNKRIVSSLTEKDHRNLMRLCKHFDRKKAEVIRDLFLVGLNKEIRKVNNGK